MGYVQVLLLANHNYIGNTMEAYESVVRYNEVPVAHFYSFTHDCM